MELGENVETCGTRIETKSPYISILSSGFIWNAMIFEKNKSFVIAGTVVKNNLCCTCIQREINCVARRRWFSLHERSSRSTIGLRCEETVTYFNGMRISIRCLNCGCRMWLSYIEWLRRWNFRINCAKDRWRTSSNRSWYRNRRRLRLNGRI